MILPTHTPALFNAAVQRAAELLRAGEVVALPTETVYGLAANAFDSRAVSKIFTAKGRPAHNPIIVHVAGVGMAKQCVADWPTAADALAKSFWPGPLTMVLQRKVAPPLSGQETPAPRGGDFLDTHRREACPAAIPDNVTAGGDTVGVRWPSHPFIQAVIRECGFPLAAPSANRSNEISPTSAEHVQKSLGDRIPLIVDGGQSHVGIESTVIDLTVSPPRVLRPGMIHQESLQAVIGNVEHPTSGIEDSTLKSPGQLKKHYAPKARLLVLNWQSDAELQSAIANSPPASGNVHIIAHTRIPAPEPFARVSVIPHDAEAFARAIYAELHRCDELEAEMIVVEALPETTEWRAIADRLNRAAAT